MYVSLWDVTISHKHVTQCKSHSYIGAWCCVHWGMWGMGLTREAVWLVTWGIVLTWEIEVKKLWLTCDLFTSNQPASAYSMNGTSTPVQCVQYLCNPNLFIWDLLLNLDSSFSINLKFLSVQMGNVQFWIDSFHSLNCSGTFYYKLCPCVCISNLRF